MKIMDAINCLITRRSVRTFLDKIKISNFIYYMPNFARISFPFFD